MDIEFYNGLKNRQGLVPMVIRRPFAPYKAGSVAGFTPRVAKLYHEAGDAVPVGMKMAATDGKRPGPKAKAVAADATGKPKKVAGPPVVIPDNWATLHHLQRVKLGKSITGNDAWKVPDGMSQTDYADMVIGREMELRGSDAEPEESEEPDA